LLAISRPAGGRLTEMAMSASRLDRLNTAVAATSWTRRSGWRPFSAAIRGARK
jgi:hypothetical protein